MLTALSPLDGRYAASLAPLRPYFSEYALMRYRTLAEVRYLIALSEESRIPECPRMTATEKKILEDLIANFGEQESKAIKKYEQTTNHDVKAVEYFLQSCLEKTTLKNRVSFIHFALTSEDTNSLAYALMLRDGMKQVLLPKLKEVEREIRKMATKWKKIPMLSRTHGQSATPTTVGKELLVFAERLSLVSTRIAAVPYRAKLGGATGTFAAQHSAYPAVDWPKFAARYIKSLGLTPNLITTQIEPHDYIVELSDALRHAHNILTDFSRDMWQYISLDYFKLRRVNTETGSSTMPHKVNPIDFENAEGNFGMANAVLEFFSNKLPISRLQRDLTDSTVLRNLGVALGHGYLAYTSLLRGMGKVELHKEALADDLSAHPEVLAEAIQTVLRKYGDTEAYEKLKTITRGHKVTALLLAELIRTLDISDADKKRLLELTPATYIGTADRL